MAGDAPETPPGLQRLEDYSAPGLPADQNLRKLWKDLRRAVRPDEETGPVVEAGLLGHTAPERLDRVAPPPACAPVLRAMDVAFGDWRANPSGLRLVVMPPGDDGDVVEGWARRHGLPILPVPRRALLAQKPGPDAPDLAGDGILVIPRLERWFLRREDGLTTMRALLAALAAAERPILVGCGSWAWPYLSATVDAGLALPAPLTFRPFDGAALRDWFADLSAAPRNDGMLFRLAATGDALFGAEDDADADADDGPNRYFTRLAARSRGIPWIAWAIWRASISDLKPGEDDAADAPGDVTDLADPDTYWIAAPEAVSLPHGRERPALLLLHAVLTHGRLEADLLARIVPVPDPGPLLSALTASGLLRAGEGGLAVTSAGYPSVRSALGNAGFPMDGI